MDINWIGVIEWNCFAIGVGAILLYIKSKHENGYYLHFDWNKLKNKLKHEKKG